MEARELAWFRKGDALFFRELVERYSGRLMYMVGSFAQGYQDSHDLVQEVWVRVFEKRMSYSGEGSLASWIFGITRNVCLEYARNEGNRARHREEKAHEIADSTHGRAQGVEDDFAHRELRRKIIQATQSLTARERDVLIRRVFEGKKLVEVARELDCAEGTARSLFHRALKKVRTNLDGRQEP